MTDASNVTLFMICQEKARALGLEIKNNSDIFSLVGPNGTPWVNCSSVRVLEAAINGYEAGVKRVGKQYQYDYEMPSIAADVVLLTMAEPKILLIKRGKDPFKGKHALPGGYINIGEEADVAAARELQEETGIQFDANSLKPISVYSKPGRDPRGRVVSFAFLAISDSLPNVKAGDDASDAEFVSLGKVTSGELTLAFDHLQIVNDALKLTKEK